jgi:hypothetical protein
MNSYMGFRRGGLDQGKFEALLRSAERLKISKIGLNWMKEALDFSF